MERYPIYRNNVCAHHAEKVLTCIKSTRCLPRTNSVTLKLSDYNSIRSIAGKVTHIAQYIVNNHGTTESVQDRVTHMRLL